MAGGMLFLLLLIIAGAAILYCLPRGLVKKILSTIGLLGIGLLLAVVLGSLLHEPLSTPAWMFSFLILFASIYLVVWLVSRIVESTPTPRAPKEHPSVSPLHRYSGGVLIAASVVLGILFLLALAESDGSRITDAASLWLTCLFAGAVFLFIKGISRLGRSPEPSSGRASCPPIELLKDLLAERLRPKEQIRLAAHLDGCSACQHRVEGLTAGRQSWFGMAKKLSDHPASPEPALRKVMDRLKEDKQEATSDEPALAGDLPLGFLSPSAKPEQLGRLERYEVLEEIGRGGMGVVLKAFDPSLHRVVAIKVLAPQLATSGVARKRFLREAKAAAAVTHEHIVTIHAVDEANGLPYLVMQYVAGQSLQDRIDKEGPLELIDILRIGIQTASGLAAAHGHGIVHRDIKPANILLEEGVQRVKITDFGLARAMDDASLTQSGFVAGSPLYMAPEQARGEALDHRADLFSLGSVLYTMCTGRPPFRAANTLAVLRRVSEDSPRPIRETNPEIPEWLVDVIAKLMAKEPAERYQSAAEVEEMLGKQLAQFQHGSWIPPTRSPSPVRGKNDFAGLPTSLTICPSCGAGLHVPERMVGTIVHCAECGKPFHVEDGSDVIQLAQPVVTPLVPRSGTPRRVPRWVWIAGGCAALLLFVLYVVRLNAMNRAAREAQAAAFRTMTTAAKPTIAPPAPQGAFGKRFAHPSNIPQIVVNNAATPADAGLPGDSWKKSLSWLPGEASLFGAIAFRPFGSLTLDDPVAQAFFHLLFSQEAAELLTTENLGRIRIDGLSLAYYEETKTESARALVHLEGLALDGRKRIIDFIRRENEDDVQVVEKNIPSVTGKSARISGPQLPLAVGIYDDQHVFLASALRRDAKQAQHVKALELLPWFESARSGPPWLDVLSGYNPPWMQEALNTISADAFAVLIGEIPAEGRELLTEALSLRVCPRSFVFEMKREGADVVLSISLNVDKAGGETLLLQDLEKWRLRALDTLRAKFPGLKKEREALALLDQTLKTMRWGANPGSKSVQTSVSIHPPTWEALGEVVKKISRPNDRTRKNH